jgi:transcriptional regulator with XRE-family HTH domain
MLDGENKIRVWREYRGLTVKALAEAAGVTPAYLSQIETGAREGTIETLKKLSAALRVTIDDILFDRTRHPEVARLRRGMTLVHDPELDARVLDEDGKLNHVRYTRMIIPMVDAGGQPMLVGASVVNPAVDIRPKGLQKP